jgi:hypothetical protein
VRAEAATAAKAQQAPAAKKASKTTAPKKAPVKASRKAAKKGAAERQKAECKAAWPGIEKECGKDL